VCVCVVCVYVCVCIYQHLTALHVSAVTAGLILAGDSAWLQRAHRKM
jgi:hypothetical protein